MAILQNRKLGSFVIFYPDISGQITQIPQIKDKN